MNAFPGQKTLSKKSGGCRHAHTPAEGQASPGLEEFPFLMLLSAQK